MSDDLVIDESNFEQYFFDVRKHQPIKGQVMARYAAAADLMDGYLKRDIVDLLSLHQSPETVVKLMKKVGCATDRDSIAVPLAMARDLLTFTPEAVALKPYRFICEAFFYTQREHIPMGDTHWTCVTLNNLNEFLDANNQKLKMEHRFVENVEDLTRYAHDPAGSNGTAGLDDSEANAGPIIDGEECPR